MTCYEYMRKTLVDRVGLNKKNIERKNKFVLRKCKFRNKQFGKVIVLFSPIPTDKKIGEI